MRKKKIFFSFDVKIRQQRSWLGSEREFMEEA